MISDNDKPNSIEESAMIAKEKRKDYIQLASLEEGRKSKVPLTPMPRVRLEDQSELIPELLEGRLRFV